LWTLDHHSPNNNGCFVKHKDIPFKCDSYEYSLGSKSFENVNGLCEVASTGKCRYTTCKSNQTGYQTNTEVSADPKPNRLSQRAMLTRSLRDYHKDSSDPKPYCSLRKVLGVRGNFRERPVFSYIRIVNAASSTSLPPSAMYLRTN